MRTSNVSIVEQAYDALRRRDVAAAFALFAPDVELYQSEEIPWGGSYKGHEEAAVFFGKLIQTITSTVTLERCIDAGDHVVALGRTRGTVNDGGQSFDVPIAHVWTLRDGLVVRVRFYIDNPMMRAALP